MLACQVYKSQILTTFNHIKGFTRPAKNEFTRPGKNEKGIKMSEFIKVCTTNDLVKNSGVAALVQDTQIALFYINGQVFALNNYDPIGQANVMSRGMIGDLKGQLMVAAPLQKQHYNLQTGECLDVEGVSINTYETKLEHNNVFIKFESES